MLEFNKSITGNTKMICLLGNPISHTISPAIHNTLSQYSKHDLVYMPFKVEKVDLENAVKGLMALGAVGFNVTVPYKEDIMKFIDENSQEAILMGAVNTVKNIDGKLYGYNTDAEGFSKSFKEESKTDFKGKKIVMIGAGGAARGIAVKLANEGASKISIINRTYKKALDIANMINHHIKEIVNAYDMTDPLIYSVLKDSDIIINTTKVGMYPDIDEVPIENMGLFLNKQIVYDVIYNPGKTKFLLEAEKAGCIIINGLGMLIYQAVLAYEIWTQISLSEEIKRKLFQITDE